MRVLATIIGLALTGYSATQRPGGAQPAPAPDGGVAVGRTRRSLRSLSRPPLNARSLAGRESVMRLGFQFVGATVVAATVMVGGRAAPAAPTKTLVFEGTVTSIRTIDHELTAWLVTVAVRKVISGEFAGSSLDFAVHSPARAGLKEGGCYTVEAVWKDGGYTVDETQWRRRKRLQCRSSPTEPANEALQRTIALPRCARAGTHR
jgi:hypothetical protein